MMHSPLHLQNSDAEMRKLSVSAGQIFNNHGMVHTNKNEYNRERRGKGKRDQKQVLKRVLLMFIY